MKKQSYKTLMKTATFLTTNALASLCPYLPLQKVGFLITESSARYYFKSPYNEQNSKSNIENYNSNPGLIFSLLK